MDPQAGRFLPESLCSAATKATISQTPNMEPKESKELRTEQKKISPCAALLGRAVNRSLRSFTVPALLKDPYSHLLVKIFADKHLNFTSTYQSYSPI